MALVEVVDKEAVLVPAKEEEVVQMVQAVLAVVAVAVAKVAALELAAGEVVLLLRTMFMAEILQLNIQIIHPELPEREEI